MEDSISTIHNRVISIRDYLRTSVSFSLLLNPCFDGYFSRFTPEVESHSGSIVDLAYSKPFLVLDVIWNMVFVLVSVFVLLCTLKEKPSCPLRVWISGYALQCVLHVGLVSYDYQRRIDSFEGHYHNRTLKRLESANTIASSFWWVCGIYWIVTGGPSLLQGSPHLYWLAVVFLVLDVFFMIFCIGLACIICLAFFCCIPIVAIAYAMTIKEGASEEEIRLLPKFKFHPSYAPTMSTSEIWTRSTGEIASQFENFECCICLMQYVDGVELCILPCHHHFHYGCISRWLQINATCPLCKFNIKAHGDTIV